MARPGVITRQAVPAVVALLFTACGGGAPERPDDTPGDTSAAAAGNFSPRTYERSFVFANADGDSLFLVPWIMKTEATADAVRREATGWVARTGSWERFYTVQWETPPTRAPSRTLPFGNLGFVVREGGAIDGVLFEEGPRKLELALRESLGSWVGSGGETVELVEASAYVSGQRVDGVLLDLARVSAGDGPAGGDWAFLVSGDSARFVIAAEHEHGIEPEPAYRGWGDAPGAQLQWPIVLVDWWQTQAFPPARRDVPVAWRVWSADGLVEAELRAVSSDIRAGEGPGPLLPVRALFEVVGEVSTVEGSFPVRGLFVHERR